jgi:hypothetical protein
MEQQEALEQIKLIRETMQKATQKFFFSPWQWIEWGVVVILGGILTHWLLALGDTSHITTVWISVLIVGGTLEGIVWILDAQRRGIDLFSPFFLKIWGVFGCFLMPGFIMTPVFVQLDLATYLIGFWLIVAGSAMFMLVLLGDRKDILWMGLFLLLSGILSVSIFVEHALHIGVGSFGIGGLLFGIYLLVKEKRHQKSEA